ncbi:hypothetical protein GGI15_003926 [Coemansia interrupta]|uniref:Uncharacterized protein n=1 Tax=Coemansia interrupta TaxID=1126814 RepID=A0A9W8H560_9FUNG|nr:hypothetical protein GGI15_003926 [Coemansia interrupta]
MAAELRSTNHQSQKTIERLERDHQHTLDELEALHKTHSRLEAQYFAGETELTTLRTKLERAQRTTLALERSLDAASASAEREREAWQKRETELGNELAAAKRKATVQRRQTVSSTPTPAHVHARSASMYAHDLPVPHLVSPLMAARSLARDPPAEPSDASDASEAQVRQLTRRLRESEARVQLAMQQVAGLQTEAQQAAGQLDMMQRKVERLEHAARQLRELNESLREDNESYQVLVHMSTMKGGFALNNARASLDSRTSSSNNVPAEADAHSSVASDEPLSGGLDLASELGQVLALDAAPDGDSLGRHGLPGRVAELEEQNTQLKESLRKTKYERRQLGEENKALSLYVNKILGRILASSDGLEAVLSRDYDPKQKPPATFSTPPQQRQLPASPRMPLVVQTLSPASNRSSSSAASRPPITAFSFAAPGSGDGITSVFVPPMSPTKPASRLVPGDAPPEAPQSPPPYTRRVRSATVAVASGDGRAADPASPTKPVAASATIGNAAGSGTWWKRMSVLRLGSAWSPPEETHAE